MLLLYCIATYAVCVDVAYCYRCSTYSIGVSVCVLDTLVSAAKMAEPIKMPFEMWAQIGPRNHMLDGGMDSLWERALLGGHAHVDKLDMWPYASNYCTVSR